MISPKSLSTSALVICIAALAFSGSSGFTARSAIQSRSVFVTSGTRDASSTSLSQFGKKKEEEDLSFIETRDLTREEMIEINRRNEEVMNRELGAMTGISVLFSIPILYLCWVAFFSD
eukprot:CAMPEP_0181111490 /NCGR_PEP_ID=MMETSP1071-20121207/19303_1 /TAXON_ID=35127 /ORGANISM="Thalassiosira sp., Strain NH16" /LENGTH=117 /DNA_ID=CAMNT_0023195387 /DNA_START=97 /DNA_END=450 /DNA_ORIENTATION=-